ncbi:uncharacterized protein [Nicotiana tomentosiformis]|uniref:uncharacterized protein n=1 Tax=Nicotiana tomentosiformis TaxID=4098 RepID=UPI00388CE45F
MEHETPKPDCILQIKAIGCCNVCAKKVRKRILRLEGVYSVEMDRERRWVKIAGNVESVMDYFTRRSGKLTNAKVIFYCSKEAKTDVKYHGKKNQRDEYTHENTSMENQAENNLPKETQNPYNEYHCHQKNIPKNNCPMQNNSSDTRERNYYKREGENCNQDSSTHTTGDHYAPRKDWVHRVENYVPPPPKEDQYRSVRVDDRECKCEFHAWKRQGSSSSSGRFVFDHRVPRADMRSASARWFREEPPFMPLPRPPLGPFAYR